jgi:formate dehydrogenase iron-sulfur subunit
MEMHPRALDHELSDLDRVIEDEAELTAGVRIRPGRSYGFFTDTTLCIGCKACEVACKEWNNLPADGIGLTGHSYDNTTTLSANSWRHVMFIETAVRDDVAQPFQSGWLMMSDVCKHCHNPPCLEACPTGALFRTEFDTVVVQQDICNGCGCACRRARLASSISACWMARRTNARCAMIGSKADWNPPAPRPARPTPSSSAR